GRGAARGRSGRGSPPGPRARGARVRRRRPARDGRSGAASARARGRAAPAGRAAQRARRAARGTLVTPWGANDRPWGASPRLRLPPQEGITKMGRSTCIGLVLACLVAAPAGATDVRYTLTDIGRTTQGLAQFATADELNAAGQSVLGWNLSPNGSGY